MVTLTIVVDVLFCLYVEEFNQFMLIYGNSYKILKP